MKSTTWFRCAAVIQLLFAVGHTIGFLSFKGSTPEALAVWTSMEAVHFAARPGGAATLSYGGFYLGFGLFITLFDLFQAWLMWRLGAMARRGSTDAAAVGWALFAMTVFGAGLSLKFFSAAPMFMSFLEALCLFAASWLTQKEVRSGTAP